MRPLRRARLRRLVVLRRRRFAAGLALTLSLAFVAGMADAIGLILVGRYVSFMSGNTTEFALTVVDGELGPALFLAAVVGSFVLGNALGEIVMALTGRRQWALLLIVAGLIAVVVPMDALPWSILPAVAAMGALNAAIDRVGENPFGITFVTGALSRFGRGLGRLVTGERKAGWTLQAVPWLGMFAGVFAGALLHRGFGVEALYATVLTTLAVALACLLMPRSWRSDFTSATARRR